MVITIAMLSGWIWTCTRGSNFAWRTQATAQKAADSSETAEEQCVGNACAVWRQCKDANVGAELQGTRRHAQDVMTGNPARVGRLGLEDNLVAADLPTQGTRASEEGVCVN